MDYIGQYNNSEVCEDSGNGFASNFPTPIFMPQLSDPSDRHCASVSGFSTPDFANQHEASFASVVEEPFLDDNTRIIQAFM